MTAYGRANAGPYTIEIHSVNRKGLELSVYVPRELLRFDIAIRKWLKKILKRGSVSVRISLEKSAEDALGLPGAEELRGVKKHFEGVAESLWMDSGQLSLPFLCEQYRAAGVESACDVNEDELKAGVEAALKQLLEMKEAEGKALATDVLKRLEELKSSVAFVEGASKEAPDVLRGRMEERLRVLNVDQEGINKEIVLFAEKADITEELVRMRSHLSQFETVMKSEEQSVGRTLDFLLIEMGRELNTMASKSFQVPITDKVPLMKAEVEKIREQVQNIE